ncbi:DUF4192 domain-containing protein [Streptomyces brevispora]|uniref:DUF4192 domain-containing protein n=1 Tax=Streptomyces brevispora TaxID=887462 RepID=A0A561V3E9_9ACTN|nr:DUF4192 domain-containing protein [Streptomyces brevispora]TWG06141.1 uncharacterized protein DUF4192 [Streptomyces brevispora]WSC12896.1 DUF4192 domain-containing protein [Streptomyces brevispora]
MNKHHESTGPSDEQQITLRGPAELADALPYLMGFHPNDSVVMVALHGGRGRFGGRLRLGIPQSAQEWPSVAEQLAECLITGSERRGSRPDAIVIFLCQDPAEGETGNQTMERLRPFAQRLRTACGALDVPVLEALCISDNRYWSYCCPDVRCCPADGNPLAIPGTSVMAAAATYAGIQVRGSLREMESRLAPQATTAGTEQQQALDSAGATLLPKLLDEEGRREVGGSTLKLARRLMKRLVEMPAAMPSLSDHNDDRLISHEEAAAVILGLQDRETRDKAAEWMEGPEAESALRLWRALARRCVAPYEEHAAAPLTLAGWVAWSTGDEPAARVALGLALRLDPGYTFAQLLHEACNQGLDPETLRRCLRGERTTRTVRRGHRTGRVAGARSVRAQSAGRRGARPAPTRPATATGRRRAEQPRAQGRRGTRTRR